MDTYIQYNINTERLVFTRFILTYDIGLLLSFNVSSKSRNTQLH